MSKSKWFNIHSWIGFKLSVLLSFILVTGTLAVVSHEIDWLTNPAKRVSPSSVQELRWDLVYIQAKQTYPNLNVAFINAPIDPWFSMEVVLNRNENTLFRAYFHPTTGEYLGEGRWYNWQRFFRMTHRHLMMPKLIGITIVGSLGVFLLVSLVTSMVIYPKWWKGFFRKPRTHHRKVFWGDLHRLFGVWSMWFVLIIGVTGVWYLVEVLGLNAKMPSRGVAVSQQALNQAVQPSADNFTSLLSKVKQDFSDLDIKTIAIPSRKKGAVQFQGQATAVLVRPRANLIAYDPVTLEQVTQYKGEGLSIHARISEAADPLHFGTFAGIPSKVVYFVFGLMLSTLAISGTYIYGMRIARVHRNDDSPNKKIWTSAFATMRWGKWTSYGLMGICGVLTVAVFTGLVNG
jgi:uncharacterized iron-regulated membrane protein